jgi:chromosome segregation ATPase
MMWNPWKKAQKLTETVSELCYQLQLREKGSKDLAQELQKAKEDLSLLKSQLNHALQKAAGLEADSRASKQANHEIKVQLAQLKQDIASAHDAHSLLSQLAHSRLEKLNQARSLAESHTPSHGILRSHRALRAEAEAANKILQAIRELL